MKKQWLIRKAQSTDVDGLQQCMQAAYVGYQSRMHGKRLPPMDVDYAVEINEYPSWVVDWKGKIVGGLVMMYEQDYATIANIAVSPMFQGQGVGGGLMKFAGNMARQHGYRELRLATHILLTENLALYKHLNWQEIDRDEVRIYMKKNIVD